MCGCAGPSPWSTTGTRCSSTMSCQRARGRPTRSSPPLSRTGRCPSTSYPDWYFTPLLPGHPLNWSGVNDPKLTEMIKLQRRTDKERKRREIVYDIQRYFSQQVYFAFGPSVSAVATWMPYVRDFGPNIGPDYGGRLVAAWLDK